MVWSPADRLVVLTEADPPESVCGPPMVLGPSLKVTVPFGVPEPGWAGETVAENVTDCPNFDAFCELVTLVVVSSVMRSPMLAVPPLEFARPALGEYVKVVADGVPVIGNVPL